MRPGGLLMPAFRDLAGYRFGRLSVLARAGHDRHGKLLWRCRCSCGVEVIVQRQGLRSGDSKSCGCLKRELDSRRRQVRQRVADRPEYRSWKAMRERCLKPSAISYPRYGARGIAVCNRWRESFVAFFADMGPRPAGTSLDRIDVGGNYEPGNCRWATRLEQARNRRNNRLVEFRGERIVLSALAERYGLTRRLLRDRLEHGWNVERALFEPRRAA